jgi:hypothetical protein
MILDLFLFTVATAIGATTIVTNTIFYNDFNDRRTT